MGYTFHDSSYFVNSHNTIADNCVANRSSICFVKNDARHDFTHLIVIGCDARSRTRTGTDLSVRGILSPSHLSPDNIMWKVTRRTPKVFAAGVCASVPVDFVGLGTAARMSQKDPAR